VIAEFKPDIIDVWEEPYGAVSFQAAYLRREYAPRAKLICETEQNLDKRLPPPFEFFRSYALAQADFVVGRNREAIGVVRNHGYRGPAEVVGNAVDPELFRPLDQGECRAEVGQNGFLVGYIGRLVEEKGLLDLVDALEFCPPRVKALFIGSGELAHVIPARAAARGMGSRVKVIPAQSLSQLPRWMNALDVLVLPSRTTSRWKEQFGRVIIEAQACGKPVIGSSSGAIPDVVGDGGIVVPERQPAALAQAINRLAAEPDLLRRMADAGARHVAQNYTWQAVASRMCAIYQRIAREPSVASEPSTASRAPAPAQALV
jgi:glycosyltransferase involved in cell wall biosynthesis